MKVKTWARVIGGKTIIRNFNAKIDHRILEKAGWIEVKQDERNNAGISERVEVPNPHAGFHEIPTIPGVLPEPEQEEEIENVPVTAQKKIAAKVGSKTGSKKVNK